MALKGAGGVEGGARAGFRETFVGKSQLAGRRAGGMTSRTDDDVQDVRLRAGPRRGEGRGGAAERQQRPPESHGALRCGYGGCFRFPVPHRRLRRGLALAQNRIAACPCSRHMAGRSISSADDSAF